MKPATLRLPYSPLRLLDRPIAFHRCFVTLTGSITAALMLSQAVYWQQRTKHEDGWWFKTRDEWTEETGMSRREQETARRRLRQLGLLHEERRGVPAQLWYRVDEIRLLELLEKLAQTAPSGGANPLFQLGGNALTGRAETCQPVGTFPPNKKGQSAPTFKGTEITTETTTTTPNPSSTNARAVEATSAVGGRSGAKDEKSQGPNGSNHGKAQPMPDEEKTVTRAEVQSASTTGKDRNTPTEESKTVRQEEWIESQQPELIYPTKLTVQEQEDIAQQIGGLSVQTVQQMLDVLESHIRSGQIRTNPAAVFRGIMRKHRTDPKAFDPSSGFQIAAQRRRQAELEEHQRQAEKAHLRRLEEATAALHAARQRPRERSEGQRRFVRDAMEAIRGSRVS